MKKLNIFFAITLLVIAISTTSCSKGFGVKLDKETYTPGETITVTYTADPTWDDNAWIGIIPSATPHGKEVDNDAVDISYQYIHQSASGVFEFTAPTEPGKYDIRMNDSDDGGKGVEISSVTFEVK